MTGTCQSTLVFRCRRGISTSNDEIALRAHLRTCSTCDDLFHLLGDFDRADDARSEDGDVVARLAEVAARAVETRSRTALTTLSRFRSLAARRSWLLVAAAIVCVAAGAFGARKLSPGASAVQEAQVLPWARAAAGPSAMVVRAASALSCTACVGVASSVESPPPASAPPGEALPSSIPRRALTHAVAAAGSALRTPGGLYQQANDARRSGDARRAIELYGDLQRLFPRSPEAALSPVSLGGLLLDAGSPQRALEQYDRYLASSGPQSLGSEALYGRARALARLGRSAEEAATWRRLLNAYPHSPYASTARRRLAELP